MIDYLETIPLNFDRYFTKIDEYNLAQNDMHRASFDLEKNLIQLGNIPKVIFVMTNSAFVHLIYNLSKQNEDELKIPVMVKSLDNNSIKVVFIEKPYIAKNLNQRDKNEKFYKRSLMVTLVKNQISTRNNSKKLNINSSSATSDRNELKPITDANSANYETENKLVSFYL